MRTANVFVNFVLLILVSVVYCSCPNGWVRHDTTCYHFSHDTESMFIANLACQQMGGKLVEIETSDENLYLAGHIKNLYGYYWIGLTDIQEETVWVWSGSKQMITTNSYKNWRAGEPNSVGNDENCVVMDKSNGQWVDVSCHTFFHYICEKKDTESEIIG